MRYALERGLGGGRGAATAAEVEAADGDAGEQQQQRGGQEDGPERDAVGGAGGQARAVERLRRGGEEGAPAVDLAQQGRVDARVQ